MEQDTSTAPTPLCDPAAFAQVWDRVAPGEGCPVEPTAAPPAPLPPQEDPSGRQLQELILECLHDAAVYRDLTRRSRRARSELAELAQRKTHQARRLSAAYFLLTGVRYWPQSAVPTPPESFFPILRQQFLAERRYRESWQAMGQSAPDPDLRELYLSLAGEAGELARLIRLIVERET